MVEINVRGHRVTVLRPRCAIKSTATWQRTEIRVSILLGIKVAMRFHVELWLSCYRVGLWSAECGQVSQYQHMFAG